MSLMEHVNESFDIHTDLYFPFIFETLLADDMGLHETEIGQPCDSRLRSIFTILQIIPTFALNFCYFDHLFIDLT